MGTEKVLLYFVLTFIYLFCLLEVEAVDSKEDECNKKSNGSCSDCVAVKGCFYCVPTKKCASDVVKAALHASCKDNQWKIGQCFLTGKILLIVLPSLGGVILISLCCVIYCCCCRKKKRGSGGEDKQEAKWRRQHEEIEIKHTARRAERQQKYDDIRKKYGLYRKEGEEGDEGKYNKFSNEA